jgi:hypothetical protein
MNAPMMDWTRRWQFCFLFQSVHMQQEIAARAPPVLSVNGNVIRQRLI